MNRTEFIIATAIILFVAFILGWFSHWLVNRFMRVAQAEIGELDKMAQQLHEAEEQRDSAITYFQRATRMRTRWNGGKRVMLHQFCCASKLPNNHLNLTIYEISPDNFTD